MKLPALQFYPGDWKKDPGVQSLTFEDRGIWIEILFLMHESERRGVLLLNGKKMTNEQLSRNLGLDIQILTKTLTSLKDAGVSGIDPDTGALMNRRMVRDENLRQIRKNCGSLGGNPVLVNQNSTTEVNQKPTPSSSSSSSSSNKNRSFKKPTYQEISDYGKSIDFEIDAETFIAYYEARGWKLGKGVSMKDWKSAVVTWKKNGVKNSTNASLNSVAQIDSAIKECEKTMERIKNERIYSSEGPDGMPGYVYTPETLDKRKAVLKRIDELKSKKMGLTVK